MATINIKCPVCGDILDNGVCPKCGYLLIVFPDVVPGSIKEAERKRVAAAKGMANKLNKIEKDSEASKTTSDAKIKNLNSRVADLEDELKSCYKDKAKLEREHSSLKTENSEMARRIDGLIKSISQSESDASSQEHKLKVEISKLEAQLAAAESEINKLKNRKTVPENQPTYKKSAFCKSCGTKFTSDATDYCTVCGTKRYIFKV